MHPCPDCQHPSPRQLEDSGLDMQVIYFRCDQCAHVFHVPKSQPNAQPTSNTVSRTHADTDQS